MYMILECEKKGPLSLLGLTDETSGALPPYSQLHDKMAELEDPIHPDPGF